MIDVRSLDKLEEELDKLTEARRELCRKVLADTTACDHDKHVARECLGDTVA
jgi:hypothetical protein